tara:strand:+ start:2899 stop:3345 length:447 start_codon:yes stop_codon:yes gene_type:complete
MGKGGANPYPFWWASSPDTQPHNSGKPKTYAGGDPYRNIEKEREEKERDDYYREKGWSQREKERKEKFKEDFMRGAFFEEEETCHSNYAENLQDIDPIFKIKKSSSEEDFKKVYRELILKNHPDKGGDSSMFIKIRKAWENLSFNLGH